MKHRRSLKLILPRLQLKLILTFFCLSAIAMLLQYLLLLNQLSRLASELPHDGLVLMDELGPLLGRIFGVSAFVLMPLTLVVGILATQRFAGPIHRFKRFLEQVIDGKAPPDCRLRKGDELQDLCTLINEATAPVRQSRETAQPRAADQPPLRAAS